MKAIKLGTICLILAAALMGCGGGGTGTTGGNPTPQGKLVDPSGNWKQSFVDASGNTFILSALYNQVGAVVSGVNFSEVGNQAPGFQCAAQRDISLSNGLVSNVSTFTGTLSGNFGTISFNSTLNDAGTHAAGTYTVTPGANGNCLGIALTGTFTGDEVPSMSGNWTGTVTCVLNCPTGSLAAPYRCPSVRMTRPEWSWATTRLQEFRGSAVAISFPIRSATISLAVRVSSRSWVTTTAAQSSLWVDQSKDRRSITLASD
jgi:hypothetical protein